MAQSFGEGFASGLQISSAIRQRQFEKSIDDAGKSVQEEMQKEKDFKAQQKILLDNARSNNAPVTEPVNPSVYQQGDSLGLTGYQTGNKPIQTTVPIAPPGYMSREGEAPTPGFGTGGYYEPDNNTSANPLTEQTLLGNYATTAAFKGEKPTEADVLRMRKDPTEALSSQFQSRPFTGKNEQVDTIADLAVKKEPQANTPNTSPKILDTLNDQVTVADRAKEIYDYNTRVIQKLQQGGNARAALEFQSKVANAELTLAQADHMKLTTILSVSEKIGDVATNALEAIQQNPADANKIFYDMMTSAKNDLGYTGKIPFSLDPRENIKTLEMLSKDSMKTKEKAELGIKQAAQAQKTVFDNAELAIKQENLTLEKIKTGLAINKENREQTTASFNRLAENVRLQYQYVNGINSTITEKDKEALKPVYQKNLENLQAYSKALNIPMPNIAVATPGNALPGIKPAPQVGTPAASAAAPTPAPAASPTGEPGTYTVNLNKDNEPGGYVQPEPVVKTPAQVKADAVASKKASNQIEENNRIVKTLAERLTSKKTLATNASQKQMVTDQEIAKIVKAKYDKDWNKTKAFWSKVAGTDDQAVLDQIEELKKQNKELENK